LECDVNIHDESIKILTELEDELLAILAQKKDESHHFVEEIAKLG
jgi:hypothetical protein